MTQGKAHLHNREVAIWSSAAAVVALVAGLSVPRFALFGDDHGSMLAVHLLLEMFSAMVAALVVVIAWHSFKREGQALARPLIFTFTVTAGMDLVHALSYAGMPELITPSSTAKAIFFWFMGRWVELLGVWMVLLQVRLPGKRWQWQLAALLCVALLVYLGARHLDAMPLLFVPGQGVTDLKVGVGWAITAGNLLAALHLWRRAQAEGRASRYHCFAASCVLVSLGEVNFSSYVSAGDFQVIFGHLFKVGAYILIYMGAFRDGLQEPYRLLQRSERALSERQTELNAIFSHIHAGVARLDRAGRYVHVNGYLARHLGKSREDIVGQPFEAFLSAQRQAQFCYHWAKAMSGYPAAFDTQDLGPDGDTRHVSAWITPERDADGVIVGAVLVAIDVTEQTQMRQQLDESMAQVSDLQTALDAHAIVAVTDARGVILSVNDKFCAISKFTREELIGHTHGIINSRYHPKAFFVELWRTIASGQVWSGEVCNRAKDGELYWVNTTIVPFFDASGKPERYVAIRADITERKRIEQQVQKMAYHDALTGLPNRRMLMDRLEWGLASSERSGKHGALLLLDLDHFKNINDTLGHDQGDRLLQEVSERLVRRMRQRDTVARLGGDEFVVLLMDVGQTEAEASLSTGRICEEVLQHLCEPFMLNHSAVSTSPSIGAVLFQGQAVQPAELMKRADISLYEAKGDGRKRVRFFDPAIQSAFREQLAMEEDLRKALALHQFELFCQPIVDTAGRIVAQEALLRWRHPGRGLVPPTAFIATLERNGLILPVGQWVIEQACALLEAWAGDAERALWQIAVNVSPKQLQQPGFVAQVATAMQRHGVGPNKLKLEITESSLQDNVDETIEKMHKLRQAGACLAIDDFGTGYSSLSYLRHLPIQVVKIDRSFVRHIDSDERDAAIARTIMNLAANLGLEVVAEGVETEAQFQVLKALGCQFYQGYLFGRPQAIGPSIEAARAVA